MWNDLSWLKQLRLWHFAVGGAMMLIVSLYGLYVSIGEQRDRADVLAHGRDGQARIVEAIGYDSALIEWTDESGTRLTEKSRTGRGFARRHLGTTELIKYDPALIRSPVILSQVPEFERLDTYLLQSTLFGIVGPTAICAAAAFVMLRIRRMRADAAPK